MEKSNITKEGEIIVFADRSLVSKETVLKCIYWYGDKFHTNIGTENGSYVITLRALGEAQIKSDELEYYLGKLEHDLVDYQLREVVFEETRNIRDLLVAKAFSNGEFEEAPPGDASDPIGFNPIS